jgi:hypothetical protein
VGVVRTVPLIFDCNDTDMPAPQFLEMSLTAVYPIHSHSLCRAWRPRSLRQLSKNLDRTEHGKPPRVSRLSAFEQVFELP